MSGPILLQHVAIAAPSGTPQQQALVQVRRAAQEVQQIAIAIQMRATGDSIDANVSGALFELPSHVKASQLAKHLSLLSSSMPFLPRFGVAVDVLAECSWILMSHLVALTVSASANSASSPVVSSASQPQPTAAAPGTKNTAAPSSAAAPPSLASASPPPVGELAARRSDANSSPEQRASNLRTTRRVFVNQAASLLYPVSLLNISLFRSYPMTVIPAQHGADIVAWCSRLTPAPSTDKNSSSGSSSMAAGTLDGLLGDLQADVVIQLWNVMFAVSDALQRGMSTATAGGNAAYVGQSADFFAGSAMYFLGNGARLFARSNAAAAAAWCENAVSFLPIVDDHFSNSREVHQQVLFGHIPDVMSARFEVEQMAVIVAALFQRVFVGSAGVLGAAGGSASAGGAGGGGGGAAAADPSAPGRNTNPGGTVSGAAAVKRGPGTTAVSHSIGSKVSSVVVANRILGGGGNADPGLHFAAGNAATPPNLATSSSSSMGGPHQQLLKEVKPSTFASHPAKCAMACLVAAASPSSSSSDPAMCRWMDSTLALSTAFHRCWTDGQLMSNEGFVAPAGLAQFTFVAMLQCLDRRCQTAAVAAALPPWDSRFQIAFNSFSALGPSAREAAAEASKKHRDGQQQQQQQQQHENSERDEALWRTIVRWCSRVLLEYPSPLFFQMPGNSEQPQQQQQPVAMSTTTIVSSAGTTVARQVITPAGAAAKGAAVGFPGRFGTAAFPRTFQRMEFQRLLMQPFVDAMDLVAAQSPRGADLIAAALHESIMQSMVGFSEQQQRQEEQQQQQQQQQKVTASGPSTALLTKMLNSREPTSLILSLKLSATQAAAASTPAHQPVSALDSANAPGSAAASSRRALTVRANTIISIVEKIRRSLFSAIVAAEPWGKLVPRRLYCETALAFYDIIGLAFSLFASDAMSIRSNNTFVQSMLNVTRRLIPLAQPFCLAALESPTTVNQLIDRFERSMKEVESGAHARTIRNRPTQQQQQQPAAAATLAPDTKASLTYKYLVASFTLSSMTDQQGIRVMPNDVFEQRWVPLLARTCAAIEADAVTRNLLQVHCRNCCSALLRSRRTVCPAGILQHKEPTISTTTLYNGPFTTDAFIRHVSTFVSWVIRPVVQPAQSSATRRLAANTFAMTFAACIESAERLESSDENSSSRTSSRNVGMNMVPPSLPAAPAATANSLPGAVIAVNAVSQVGSALVSQIRFTAPQVLERAERAVYLDGSTRFAEGLASCVSTLDPKVREMAQQYVDQIMSSSLTVFPLGSKKRVLERMVVAVGLSKSLRGQDRDDVAQWLATNEPKWMKQDSDARWSSMMRMDWTRSKL